MSNIPVFVSLYSERKKDDPGTNGGQVDYELDLHLISLCVPFLFVRVVPKNI